MTPIDEFKELLPKGHSLTEDELITLRDLMDMQADLILDSYLKDKASGII